MDSLSFCSGSLSDHESWSWRQDVDAQTEKSDQGQSLRLHVCISSFLHHFQLLHTRNFCLSHWQDGETQTLIGETLAARMKLMAHLYDCIYASIHLRDDRIEVQLWLWPRSKSYRWREAHPPNAKVALSTSLDWSKASLVYFVLSVRKKEKRC